MPEEDVAGVPLAAAMTAAPIGVALFSPALEFVYVNAALAVINGQPIDAHLGRRARDVLGPDSERWLGLVRRVLDDGTVIGPIRVGTDGRRSFDATYCPVQVGGATLAMALVQEVTTEVGVQRRLEAVARTTELLAGAGFVAEIGDALCSSVALSFVDRISFAVVEGRHGLRTIALAGYPDEVAVAWRGRLVELSGAGPASEAVGSGEPVLVQGGAEFDARYPDYAELRRDVGDEATITAPIVVDGAVAAILHVTSTAPGRLGPEEVETTRTLAALAGLALTRVRATDELRQDEFRRALNAMVDNVTICSAIRDDDGRVVDFRMDFVKDDLHDRFGRAAPQLVGQRVLESYPNWLGSGVFDRFRQVVDTGDPWIEERLTYTDRDQGGRSVTGTWRVQVVKFGDGFLSSSRDITAEVAAERELAAARQDRAVERASLGLLQQMAVPTALPRLAGVEVAADRRPADTEIPLGGDWYDAVVAPDGRLVLIVGDVAGHDRQAATDMIRLRNITNAFAHILPSPGAILSAVAASVGGDADLMATCLIVDVRAADGRLTMSRAGHPPPIVAAASGSRLWELPSQVPLGIDAHERYLDHHLTVTEPTTLLLFTDGLVERRGEPLDDGFERLVTRVDSSRFARHPQALCRELVESVIHDRLEDDFCLLAVHLDPGAAR